MFGTLGCQDYLYRIKLPRFCRKHNVFPFHCFTIATSKEVVKLVGSQLSGKGEVDKGKHLVLKVLKLPSEVF